MLKFPRRPAVVIVAAAATLGVAACGGGVSKDKFTSDLVEKAGLTEAQATCVTDKLYAELDQDSIDNVYEADKVEDVSAEERDALVSAVTSCATGGTSTGTDTTSTGTDTTDTGSSDTTGNTDSIEGQAGGTQASPDARLSTTP